MSFFGNNNSTNSGTTFGGGGGFGSNTNTGFGANNNNTNSTPSLFGNNNASTSGFGSTGFGSNTNNSNSPFGAKPGGFGSTPATTSSSLFGGNTSTSGGFGSGFGATNTSAGFGSNANTGGSLFGSQNKPATGFGASTTGGSIFGGGNTNPSGGFGSTATNTGFGATNTSTAFGSTNNNSTGFGAFGSTQNNNGTAAAPFQPFSERDAAANQQILYQSITCQPQYKDKSFEELRVEDYLQGRRYGNSNGQAGGFGASTGFGGTNAFGPTNNNTSTSGGLFGNNNNSANTGFGGGFGTNSNATNNNTSTAFGGSGNSLFGQQNKPTTSLFGSQNASNTGGFGSTNNSTGGGLFGGGGAGGFGANNSTTNAAGGLFGNNANQQNKPGFGSGFGQTNNTTTGFGATNNSSNTGSGLFGNSANNTNTGAGLFGQNNNNSQQPQTNNAFGASTSGGLFGNQNKPATGLFGNSNNANTGGGLFGSANNQQQQPQQTNSLFGQSSNNNAGGSLFGNANQNKTGTGLFGSSTTANSGGLFGSNNQQPQQQQQTGGGLFGSSNNNNTGNSLFGNQNKPATSGLFGSTTNNNTGMGGSLFGGNSQQPQQVNNTSSLFGNSLAPSGQNQQNNSLFGGSLTQANQTPQQNQLHASLTAAPYGNEQLFGSLGVSSSTVGPLATPLTGAKQPQSKTPSLLTSTRINSPIYSPQGSFSRGGTYAYATPTSSFSGSLTPGASSLLRPTGSMGSVLGSRLAKSISMQTLRRDSDAPQGESLLRPAPGSASSRYLQTGSMRKLNIDRSIRIDLFSPPPKKVEAQQEPTPSLGKKVSFDNSAQKETAEPSATNALVRVEDDGDDSPQLFRAAPKPRQDANGTKEMEQSNGQVVPHEVTRNTGNGAGHGTQLNGELPAEIGEYWSSPTIQELKTLSRAQLAKVPKLTVGRAGIGRIEFSTCDLTDTELGDILGGIVFLVRRSATVYPADVTTKPPRGKGLNVPSTIYLEETVPKNPSTRKAVKAGKQPYLDRFVQSLRQVGGTTLKSYDEKTGMWCFTVEHFTTYGFDEDEEMEVTEDDVPNETSGLSEPPETPDRQNETMQSFETGTPSVVGMDDTFEFKVQQRSLQSGPRIPGEFEESQVVEYDYDDPSADEDVDQDSMMSGDLNEDPFVQSAGGAVQPPSPNAYQRYEESMIASGDEAAAAEEMPGTFVDEFPHGLKSILKPTSTYDVMMSPEKLANESWEDQLQRTISPRKRDRQRLKDFQLDYLTNDNVIESPFKQSMLGQSHLAMKSAKKSAPTGDRDSVAASHMALGKSQAFRNSMDLMNSLWATDKPTTRKAAATLKGFENPYHKKPRLSASQGLNDQDIAFHDSIKPSFTNDDTIVYGVPGSTEQVSGEMEPVMLPLVGEHVEIRFARWRSSLKHLESGPLSVQKAATTVKLVDGFAQAITSTDVQFASFAEISSRTEAETRSGVDAWLLASVLFDPIQTACADRVSLGGMPEDVISRYEDRLRLDALGKYLTKVLEPQVAKMIRSARTPEEAALLSLTLGDIPGACESLIASKNHRLATMVAQLPLQKPAQETMKGQIQVWRDRNDWSEMSAPIRSLYGILAGYFCTIPGSGKAAEDRAAEFCISEHFGWDWKQSLALRVFYSGFPSVTETIDAYAQDVQSGAEVFPKPGWDLDSHASDERREDVLFTILGLLASTRPDFDALFDSKNITGTYADNRLAWQLATIFSARGMGLSGEKLDQITMNFATEIETTTAREGRESNEQEVLVTTAWVLLHLQDPVSREIAISDWLSRNGGRIPEPNETQETIFNILTDRLSIPSALIWKAKAQHAHAMPNADAAVEALWLLRADCVNDAHTVLCESVGPDAVIGEDDADLADLIQAFDEKLVKPDGWLGGGAVYESFVKLMHLSKKEKEGRKGAETREILGKGLQMMEESGVANAGGLTARVAMAEMKRMLTEELRVHGAHTTRKRLQSDAMDVDETTGGGKSAFERFSAAMDITVW